MSEINVIPKPREIILTADTSVALSALKFISWKNPVLDDAAVLCRAQFAKSGVHLSNGDGAGRIALELFHVGEPENKGPESYALSIGGRDILIKGGGAAGVFYGLQTLFQLMNDGHTLPTVKITDWPELSMRGVHFMLQGPVPRFEWFLKYIEHLAALKVNTILFEYEDKFPYKKHSDINHPLAFNVEQLRRIIEVADACHIRIIPLVQSFGHVEYILKHSQYAHLREREHDPFMYCPSNPETFELFKDMASEVAEMHGGSEYFHIGADEPYFLGCCKECGKASTYSEKAFLYINHINKACRFVRSLGKRPILWSDMLVDFPQYIDSVDKDVAIMYWEYTASKPSVPWFKWKHRTYFGDDIDDVPPEVTEIYKPYWDDGGFPHSFRAFPYTKFFKDHGFEVINAPIADQVQAIDNITEFSLNAAENNCLGSVVTAWPLFPTWQTSITFTAAAEEFWNPGRRKEDFAARVSRNCLGIEVAGINEWASLWGRGTSAGRVLRIMDCGRDVANLLSSSARGKDLLLGMDMLAKQKVYKITRDQVFARTDEVMQYVRIEEWNDFVEIPGFKAPFGKESLFELENLSSLVESLKQLGSLLAQLESTIRTALADICTEEAIEEYLDSLYSADNRKLNEYLAPLKVLLSGKRLEV